MEVNGNFTEAKVNASKALISDSMIIPVGGMLVLENLIAIVILYRCKRLNFQIKILSMNLGISDISTGASLCFPLFVYQYGNNCEFKKYVAFVCVNVSLFTVTMYNLDRCLVFALGMRYYKYVQKKRLIWLCVAFWIIGVLTAYLMFYSEEDPFKIGCSFMYELKKNFISQGTKYLLLMTICSNIFMYIFLLHHIRKIKRKTGDITANSSGIEQSRIAKKISVITITFLVIATPFYLTLTFPILDYSTPFGQTAYSACGILLCMNSAMNPVFYVWRMKEPRYHLKLLFMFWNRAYCEKLTQENNLKFATYNMTSSSGSDKNSTLVKN